MLAYKRIFLLLLLISSSGLLFAQTVGDYRSVNTTPPLNWSALSTWQIFNGPNPTDWAAPTALQGYPGQFNTNSNVLIQNGHQVSLNVTPPNSIGSLTISAGNLASTLTFTGANSLMVNATITINNNVTGSASKSIAVGAGTLTCSSVVMGTTGNPNRISFLSLSTGTITVLGTITMNDNNPLRNYVNVGSGTLNIGGNVTGGNLITAALSTVNYNGLNQTVRAVTYGGNLTLSGGGTKNLTNVTIVAGDLTMSGSATTATVTAVNFSIGGNLGMEGSSTFTVAAAGFSIGGDLTMNGTTSVTLTDAIFIGGSVTLESGTSFNAGSFSHNVSGDWTNNGAIFSNTEGTMIFDGDIQTIGGTNSTIFNNLLLTGSGTKILGVTTSIIGNLSIDPGVVVDLSTILTHTAKTLSFPTGNQASGSWGSTASSATHKEDLYFLSSSPGILTVSQATYYTIATGNWNSNTTWSLSSAGPAVPVNNFPSANDFVVVEQGVTVTVTAVAACANLTFEAGQARSNNVTINPGITLAVSGGITIPRAASPNTNINTLAVGSGILNAGSIAFTSAGNGVRHQMTISSGTVTVTGNMTTDNIGNSAAITFTGAGTLNAGVGILTTGVAGGTLTTFAGSTVNYTGASPTVKPETYFGNLTLSGSGTPIMTGVTTVNGNLSLSGSVTATPVITTVGGNVSLTGTSTLTTGAGLTIGGGLSIGNGTTFTAGAFPLTVTGSTTVGGGTSGNLAISSATGAKLFAGLVTIAPGATWTNTTANSPVTFKGGITNNGTFSAGTGVHTFDTNAQQLTGLFDINNVTVTVITLTNNNTLTVATALSGTGTFTQAANAILNIGGISNIAALNASNTGNTVNYNGSTNQSIKDPVGSQYVNLSFNGTTASGFATAPAILNISGNWVNNGTGTSGTFTGFNPNGGTIIFNGTSTVSGTSITSFNNVQLSSAGILTFPAADVNISGNIDLAVVSTFNPSNGRVVMNGSTTQSINANGKEFYTIRVTNTAAPSVLNITSSLPIQRLLDIQTGTAVNSNGNLLLLSRGITTTQDGAIGPIPVALGASVNGNITMQRFMDAIGNTFRYLGSPVSGALPPAYWGSTIYTYKYTAATGAYTGHATSTPLAVGTGYVIGKNMSAAATWSVTGPISNTGSYTWNFATEGWHLVGNPFPSAIRWFASPGVAWDLTNVATTVAVTDNAVAGYPNYFRYYSYDLSNPGWGSGPLANGMVAMGQAFWVYAGVGGGSLTIREQAKENTLNGEFYRTGSTQEENVLSITLDNGKNADLAYLRIHGKATPAYEFNYDLKKLRNPEMNVYVVDQTSQHLLINATNHITWEQKIPVGIEVPEAGEYTLSFSEDKSFKYGALLYLVDTYEGTATPIINGSYSFKVNKSGLKTASRFYLSLNPAVPERPLEELIAMYPNPVADRLKIDLPATTAFDLLVLDSQGKKILSHEGSGAMEVDMTGFARGMYVIKVISSQETVVHRILKQ